MNKSLLKLFYLMKPVIPRTIQLAARRGMVQFVRARHKDVWPIDEKSCLPPPRWAGWPDGKRFAFVLTHDIDTAQGQEKCVALADIEEGLGLRSSFNFVPRKYEVSPALREYLTGRGFEIGVHGLYHDGKYFNSREEWRERAVLINGYLKEWNAVGFRTPAMHHELDWFHDLDIEYDASTFDTDPFEPYPDGAGTIFPFSVHQNGNDTKSYVELPYTLVQDFTLFVLMRELSPELWKLKLDWVARNGGMALVNTHPDYMHFNGGAPASEEYPSGFYKDFLEYAIGRYGGEYWHVLPKELSRFWKTFERNKSHGSWDEEAKP